MTDTQENHLQREREDLADVGPLPTLDELCLPFEEFLDGLESAFFERVDSLAHLAYALPGEYRAAADEVAQLYRAVGERVAIAASRHITGDELQVVTATRMIVDAVTHGFHLIATLAERDRLDGENAGRS